MPSRQVTIQGVMTWDEPVPAHPIVIPPGSIAPGVPTHPIVLPPPIPAHPIIIPPDAISPGVPAHPIVLPPYYPAHPIIIPPDAISPGVPAHPIYIPDPPLGIWGGGNVPMPTPPIHIPPGIWGPGSGFPTPPINLPPPVNLPPGGAPVPPAVGVSVPGNMVFVENLGWIFIPDSVAGGPKPAHPIELPSEG